MPFLSIAGTAVPVTSDGGAENEPLRIGESTRAFAGNLRSTVRAEKRSWSFKTVPLSFAAAATIKSALANAAQVTVSGDFNNNVAVTCEGTVSVAYFPASSGVDALMYMCVLTITLTEA